MKNWRKHSALYLSLGVVFLLYLWPQITGKAITKEVTFTILKAIALATSLNIFLGYTGYVSFGHIVYFGVGGYVGFFCMSVLGWSLWVAMPVGGLASALIAFLLGKAILRLRGAYFALATIGVNEAIKVFIRNFDTFGGPIGMTFHVNVYQDYGGISNRLPVSFNAMIVVTLLTVLVSYWVKNSKFGLSLVAIREDEDAAEVMGVVAPNAKTWAYVISAALPGIVGALFFFKNGNIEPGDAFHLHTSIEMIVMVMLGGQGTVLGPILGATGYQWLRGTLLTTPVVKDIQLTVAGVLLLVIILFAPAGAVGWARNRFPKMRRVLQ